MYFRRSRAVSTPLVPDPWKLNTLKKLVLYFYKHFLYKRWAQLAQTVKDPNHFAVSISEHWFVEKKSFQKVFHIQAGSGTEPNKFGSEARILSIMKPYHTFLKNPFPPFLFSTTITYFKKTFSQLQKTWILLMTEMSSLISVTSSFMSASRSSARWISLQKNSHSKTTFKVVLARKDKNLSWSGYFSRRSWG